MSSGSDNTINSGVLRAAEGTPTSQRLCTECSQPIPQRRLKVVPDAQQCVPCLEAMGDVPKLRQYTETDRAGERVTTIFAHDPAIEAEMARQNKGLVVPDEDSYLIACGDDSHLSSLWNRGELNFDTARHLSTEFENDAPEPTILSRKESRRLGSQKRWARYRVERGTAHVGDYEVLGMTEFHIPQEVQQLQIPA